MSMGVLDYFAAPSQGAALASVQPLCGGICPVLQARAVFWP